MKNNIPPLKEPIIEENKKNNAKVSDDEFQHGQHPNSIKALKKYQYPKGLSGNAGNIIGKRPTFEKLKKELKKLGDEETYNYHKESQGTRKEQVLKRIWFDAIKGDMKKIQLLAWLGCLD